MAIADEPILTDLYDRAEQFCASQGSIYVFGETSENRSRHVDAWRTAAEDVRFVRVIADTPVDFSAEVRDRQAITFALRSKIQLDSLWTSTGGGRVYIDITGLSHHVWAPMLRSALDAGREVAVVYVEPGQYAFNAAPTEGQIFDLSERIRGVAPLPGFASLSGSGRAESMFVPLLGFEGTRLAHVLEHVQPSADRVIPVIGIPGFRPEYPYHTYAGNKRTLVETRAWQRAEFVAANCPFGLFYLLEQIASKFPRTVLRVAPIGTKPHALGAVMFKLANSSHIDLVYDHPIRKAGRTRESDHLLVYHVSSFLAGSSP